MKKILKNLLLWGCLLGGLSLNANSSRRKFARIKQTLCQLQKDINAKCVASLSQGSDVSAKGLRRLLELYLDENIALKKHFWGKEAAYLRALGNEYEVWHQSDDEYEKELSQEVECSEKKIKLLLEQIEQLSTRRLLVSEAVDAHALRLLKDRVVFADL